MHISVKLSLGIVAGILGAMIVISLIAGPEKEEGRLESSINP